MHEAIWGEIWHPPYMQIHALHGRWIICTSWNQFWYSSSVGVQSRRLWQLSSHSWFVEMNFHALFYISFWFMFLIHLNWWFLMYHRMRQTFCKKPYEDCAQTTTLQLDWSWHWRSSTSHSWHSSAEIATVKVFSNSSWHSQSMIYSQMNRWFNDLMPVYVQWLWCDKSNDDRLRPTTLATQATMICLYWQDPFIHPSTSTDLNTVEDIMPINLVRMIISRQMMIQNNFDWKCNIDVCFYHRDRNCFILRSNPQSEHLILAQELEYGP